MKSLIKDNPLGIGLLGIAAVLLLAILLLPVFSGGVPEVEADPDAVLRSSVADITEISLLEPMAKFEVIKQQPLFNQDRKPVDLSNATAADADDSLAAAETLVDNPLEADLTGIIITKEHKIAMLWDRGSKTTISIPEGGTLEGDLSGWSLEKVEARKVSLKNRQGKTAELELLMFTQSLGKPPATGAAKKTPARKAGTNQAKDKQTNPVAKKAVAENESGKPMTAADFMRASLEKRKAARAAQQDNTVAGKKGGG